MRQGSPCRCSHPHTLPERKDWFTQLPSPMNLPIQPSTLDFQAIRSGCFGTLNLIYKIQYIELSIFYGSKISRWPDGCQPESVRMRCACRPVNAQDKPRMVGGGMAVNVRNSSVCVVRHPLAMGCSIVRPPLRRPCKLRENDDIFGARQSRSNAGARPARPKGGRLGRRRRGT